MTRPNDGPPNNPGRIFDDLSRLMTNAMGVAQGARDEAETAMKGWIDRWLAERNLVTRDEFEAVREMAVKARTENAELRAMISAMTGAEGTSQPPHVSAVEAPAADMGTATGTGTSGASAPGPDAAPHSAPSTPSGETADAQG